MRLAYIGLLITGFAISATPSSGQVVTSTRATLDESGARRYEGSVEFPPALFTLTPIPGAPYSGEEFVTVESIQPNGVRNIQTSTSRKLYRDSQGRERVESHLYLGPGMPEGPLVVEITDYLAGQHITLDIQNKIAHRSLRPKTDSPAVTPPLPKEQAETTPVTDSAVATLEGTTPFGTDAAKEKSGALVSRAPGPTVAVRPGVDLNGVPAERIGSRLIDGMLAEGRLWTNVIFTTDTERYITTGETWTSIELGVILLSRTSDPRNGDRSVQLKNLQRVEPDSSLFQIPPGFVIRDEKSNFVIPFTASR